MNIQPLEREDVPAATRLSTQAGWNQLPADWHRFLDLAPAGCHAGRVGGDLVATATVIDYEMREGGRVGWLGMVLVDEDHRRRGHGTAILQHALAAARERGIDDVGLDATDAGRAVYSTLDFVDVAPIERWGGTLVRDRDGSGGEERVDSGVGEDSTDGSGGEDPADGSGGAKGFDGVGHPVTVRSSSQFDDVASFDRTACGVDRRALLDSVLAADEAIGFIVPGNDGPLGYALLRPGRVHWHLGPIVAADATVLGVLVSAAADHLDGESVIVDPLVTPTITSVLARHGLEPQRRLTRMSYGRERTLLMGTSVVAAAGFEWG